MFNFLKNIGATELIIIGVILIVFFGARKVADLGKTAGETTKELKKVKEEATKALHDAESKAEEDEKDGEGVLT